MQLSEKFRAFLFHAYTPPPLSLSLCMHLCVCVYFLLRIDISNIINIHYKCSKSGCYWSTIKGTFHKDQCPFLFLSWSPLEEYSSKHVYATLHTLATQFDRTPCCIHLDTACAVFTPLHSLPVLRCIHILARFISHARECKVAL
jgi:hypothetical protein